MPRAKKAPTKKRGPKPRADRSLVRSMQLRIPVTEAEHAQMMRAADAAGLPLAEYVRRAIGLRGFLASADFESGQMLALDGDGTVRPIKQAR